MCGFVGIFTAKFQLNEQYIRRMAETISYRGPDDSGEWVHPSIPLAFGFRRLAILDLTPEGHQPMISRSGRYTLVFNGEIYNFRKLKDELTRLGAVFRGGSDTEVILAAFEEWGICQSVPRFGGMFAMAVWDEQDRNLTLVRDRLGKKPLYYGWSGGHFLFSSELKPFLTVPGFEKVLSMPALSEMMQRGYISAPLSIYSNIWKLVPGTVLQISESNFTEPDEFSPYPDEGRFSPTSFWSVKQLCFRDRFTGSADDAVGEIKDLIVQAVQERMVADVPLGAFLSGGIDSSLIVSVMQSLSASPIKTFTVGFREAQYDESPHARVIADYLGTEHTEVTLSAADSLSLIPRLSQLYDEPLADASQLPTFLVSEVARRSVTVALNGDGGDELFIGYNRYVYPERVFSKLKYLPLPVRRALGSLLKSLPHKYVGGIAKLASWMLPSSLRPGRPDDAVHKLLQILDADSCEEIYDRLTRYWPMDMVRGAGSYRGAFLKNADLPPNLTFKDRILLLDLANYLSEDLLLKVDRASMAASIEARSPLLDYRLVEFGTSLPPELRAPSGEKKFLLKRVLSHYLPHTLYDRPKMGFSVPIGDWFRKELKTWGRDRIEFLSTNYQEELDVARIVRVWERHQDREGNFGNELWCACVVADWLSFMRQASDKIETPK